MVWFLLAVYENQITKPQPNIEMKHTDILLRPFDGQEASADAFMILAQPLYKAAELLEKEMDGRGLLKTCSSISWHIQVGEDTTHCGVGTIYWKFLNNLEAAVDVFFHESGQMSTDGQDWDYAVSSPSIARLADLLVERKA